MPDELAEMLWVPIVMAVVGLVVWLIHRRGASRVSSFDDLERWPMPPCAEQQLYLIWGLVGLLVVWLVKWRCKR